MKTSTLTIACALGIPGVFYVLLSSPRVLAQGSLTPPGAPAPVMKTLDQIEPRTPISALPFTISAPGSYYLTGNLTATVNGAGITVSADHVTINLNGFTLAGGGTGTRTGIQAPGARKGLCVRNGTVTGFTDSAILATLMTGGSYENLRLLDNTGNALRSGPATTVRSCTVNGSTSPSPGAVATGPHSTISDCTVSSSSGPASAGIYTEGNCTIVNCTAGGNGGDGIRAGDNCSIQNCAAGGNGAMGIRAVGNGCTIAHCTANSNTGPEGILTGNDATVTDCTMMSNSSGGMQAGGGSTISRCTFAKNGAWGLAISSRSHVTGCTFESNNPSNTAENPGLLVDLGGSRIDSNHFASNGFAGLKAYNSGNLIIRNTFSGAQYIVVGGNTVGPTVDLSASGGTVSSASAGNNPWANIMF